MANKENKKQNQMDMIYGAHSIIELLKSRKRKLFSIYTTKQLPKSYKRVEQYLPKSVPNIQYVDRLVLDRMAGTTDHMGIVALVAPFQYMTDLKKIAGKNFVLLLDGVKDVRNLGAILRSASCIGVDAVILCQKNGALITAATHKASAGLVEYLDVFLAPSIEYAVSQIDSLGFNFFMAVLDNGKDATTISYKKPICLVIGSEETGISKSVQDKGTLITIPQRSPEISYNASVAAGILMFLLKHNS
ncbi:RNA methyltransferase [Candidatus Dependentiae bacterium]|nr:RNA methyltransferase [Candidatus Dependentiae bacterium]MBU4386925.1 RNA methyltransferase [Candidatus Dependentiae bacterium]MCG2756402.1 RNA methyltransferase [Candidatus Dependentiae bacterium]